jgi:hypothetical protein
MWYSTPEILDSYYQRMHKQSQIVRICKYANLTRTSLLCRVLHALGNVFVLIGIELKRLSRKPGTQNGVSIFYEHI